MAVKALAIAVVLAVLALLYWLVKLDATCAPITLGHVVKVGGCV